MLNISDNAIGEEIKTENYESFKAVTSHNFQKTLLKFFLGVVGLIIVTMFLPWTQNIRAKGYITTIDPVQRPQTIVSAIGGKIERWYVKEGDIVRKGDTLLYLSDIKDAYFDPRLLERTDMQIKAKQLSMASYESKIGALNSQIRSLGDVQKLKIQQAHNYLKQAELKLKSDSMDFEAAKIDLQIAHDQYERMVELHKEGLKSLTDLEGRRLKQQEAQAKAISAENKYLSSANALINAKLELSSIDNQYTEKVSKARSDRYEAESGLFNAQADVTKLENQLSNYSIRSGMYYVTAPQDGFITKAGKAGLGETVKEGENIVTIMPADFELAVEMYVRPIDLPLIKKGHKVRFIFDGWPTLVFSGWPNMSFGTFGGVVVAIDNYISENGRYRVLVAQDQNDVEWPKQLRFGSGADGMALLSNVPIWFEIWRQLNSFPPNYYNPETEDIKSSKDKK